MSEESTKLEEKKEAELKVPKGYKMEKTTDDNGNVVSVVMKKAKSTK